MDRAEIDDLVVRVYRARLDSEHDGDADRMVQKDGDDGTKQRNRADTYRPVVVETLVQLGLYERPVSSFGRDKREPAPEPATRFHNVERTSHKNKPFVGTCTLCGQPGLTMKDAMGLCDNVRGLTQAEALLEALNAPPPSSPPVAAPEPVATASARRRRGRA